MVERKDPAFGSDPISRLYEKFRAGELTPAAILDLTIEQAREVDAESADAIRYCAIPRHFDARIIGILRAAEDDSDRNQEILNTLLEHSFVTEQADGGYVYHDTVRKQLLEWWRTDTHRSLFETYNRRLSKYHTARYKIADELRSQFNRVSRLVRSANGARYVQLASATESLLVAPLVEALYHETLLSAEGGYKFFVDYYHPLEKAGQSSICQTLISAARDFLQRLPTEDDQDRLERWLRYYEARLKRRQGLYAEAEDALVELRNAATDDVKMKLWILSDLGASYSGRYMMREARAVFAEQLQLSVETRQDMYNIPASYARLGSIEWVLFALDDAIGFHRDAVKAARGADNRNQEARSRISLGSILNERGLREDGVEEHLEALDFIRSRAADDTGLNFSLAERLMLDWVCDDARLTDAFFAEALELLRSMDDPNQEAYLHISYIGALSKVGRLTLAAKVFDETKEQYEPVGDGMLLSEIALAEGLLRSNQGRARPSIEAYDRLLKLSESVEGTEWVSAAALSNRGMQYSKIAEWEAAESSLEQALECWDRMGHDNLITFIGAVRANGRHSEVMLRGAERRLSAVAKNGDGHYERAYGDVRFLHGDWEAAQTYYSAALAAFQGDADAREISDLHLDLASAASNVGDWANAAKEASAAVESFENLADTGGFQAHASHSGIEPEELEPARNLLIQSRERLTESSTEYYANTLRLLGSLYLDQDRWEPARDLLAKARTLQRNLYLWSAVAKTEWALARAHAGEGHWRDAAASTKTAAAYWTKLGNFDAYQPTDAEKAAADENARGVRILISVGSDRERLRTGRDLIRSAANKASDVFIYQLNLAYACARLENWVEASNAMDAALQLRPFKSRCTALSKRLAQFRLKEGEIALEYGAEGAVTAYTMARAALSGLPDDGPAPVIAIAKLWIGTGDGFLHLGQTTDAESCYRIAETHEAKIGASEHRIRALSRLALVSVADGREEEAVVRLVEAASLGNGAANLATLTAEWVDWIDGVANYRRLSHALRRASRHPYLSSDGQARIVEWRKKFAEEFLPLATRADAAVDNGAVPSSKSMAMTVTPIVIEAHESLMPESSDWEDTHPFLQRYLPEMRERIVADKGVRVPGVRVWENSGDLPHGGYLLMLHEVPIVRGEATPGQLFCGDPDKAALWQAKISREGVFDPITGNHKGFWFDPAGVPEDQLAGIESMDHLEYVGRHLEFVLRRDLASFVDRFELAQMLDRWCDAEDDEAERRRRRDLVEHAVPDSNSGWTLVQVLRALVSEGVSVGTLEPILTTVQAQEHLGGPTAIVEAIRLALGDRLPANSERRRFLHLSDDFEKAIAAGIRDHGNGRFLALEPAVMQELLTAARPALADDGRDETVVVTRHEGIRPFTRKLLELEFPNVAILSEEELRPELRQRVERTIEFDGETHGQD